jgi:Fic family protein
VGARDSREVGDGQLKVVSDEERAPREAKNSYEQFRRLEELIADAAASDYYALRPSTLMELNRLAIDGLVTAPGRYRLGAMEIPGSPHQPPSPEEVPVLVEQMCDYVNENWGERSAIHLAAYVMWRLNWIHPFQDGNGRTARAASYLVLCARLGHDLPGEATVPTHIAQNKTPYYSTLEAADRACKDGRVELSELERLLEDTLIMQIRDAATSPMRSSRSKRATSGPKTLATSEASALAVPKKTGWMQHKAAWIGAIGTMVAAVITGLATQCAATGG